MIGQGQFFGQIIYFKNTLKSLNSPLEKGKKRFVVLLTNVHF